ncbi:hypothetical protein AQ505_12995 [Pedobacter sp. PACM 27299]|uniref:hypothetical protein n=1 Tax=Pedobacter sp. PACM 27299 TaxID=1727164 RepID=UPI0007064653|nr:hypothetical protein [Pedobacter sp. PACM 27299]ALL06335.1 hypothetical protein AQ505_12995 [Pedobacter sp. PACM 27299]
MINTVFYSWQSDLPNNTNRGFLESCLKKAISNLKEVGDFSIELAIDRDTKDEPGMPDIIDTVFKKINRAKIFIADISIINSGSSDRKTPNPNVLIELGYAAKSIGWDKVICIYNKDYGSIEDLPFDIRQRRPIIYSLKEGNKDDAKEYISKSIASTIKSLNANGSLFDIINDFHKVQVDTEILTIINHLRKIIFGYNQELSFELISEFLNIEDIAIVEVLTANRFIGFQVFKRWEVNEKKLQDIVNKVISYHSHGKETATIIIQLMQWTVAFDSFNQLRKNPDLFLQIENSPSHFYAVEGKAFNERNSEFPDRFILLKRLNNEKSQVSDFGDFIETQKIEGLIFSYKLNPKYIENYCKHIRAFISITEKWLDHTNGEFIIDNAKMFEIK